MAAKDAALQAVFLPVTAPYLKAYNEDSLAQSSRTMRKAPIRPDVVAGVAVRISLQIILMLGLSLPKRTSRCYFRHDFAGPDS
jgi:hypothetical protein